MLEYAGRSVVMANASEEMLALARQQGWAITASNDDDGVALAVEEVLRQAPRLQHAQGNREDQVGAAAVVEFAQ